MILQENIEIFGKKIRVNNDNFSPIAELWGDVMVDKPAGDIFAVYSNYASDYKGDYDLLVGTKDWDEEKSVLIEAGDYLVFSVDNASHKGVEETWQKIWARDSELKRAYKTDFEWYHTSGEIDIFQYEKSPRKEEISLLFKFFCCFRGNFFFRDFFIGSYAFVFFNIQF